MPRNQNAGNLALRNRNRVTNKTRLKVIRGNIDADPIVLGGDDEDRIRVVSTAGVDADHAVQGGPQPRDRRVDARRVEGDGEGEVAPADGIHVDTIRHRRQMLTGRWHFSGIAPRVAVEHLCRLDQLLVVLPADDDELVFSQELGLARMN